MVVGPRGYMGLSGWACGNGVRIASWTPGGPPPSTVYTLPLGQDIETTFTGSTLSGDVLFYPRLKCKTDAEDIFEIADP